MLGKINAIDLLASHPLFGGWGTDRFWNIAFVAPPSGVVPPVIMGGVLTHSFAPYSLTAMVFDPNDQTTDYSINRLFDDGVNISLGLSWSGELARRKSGAGITATYSTAEGTDWSQIGLPPGSQTTHEKGLVQRRGRALALARAERRRARQRPRPVRQGGDRRRQPEPVQAFVRRRCRRPCDRARATARPLRRRLFLLRSQRRTAGRRRAGRQPEGRTGHRGLLHLRARALAAPLRQPAVGELRPTARTHRCGWAACVRVAF